MPLVPRHIQDLRVYKPGRSIEDVQRELGLVRIIKLASNENSMGPSNRVLKSLNKEILNKEEKLISEELKNTGKPDEIIKKIGIGKINKFK